MGKSSLQTEQTVTDATYVDEAASLAKDLTLRESRGPDDMVNAWNRLEARYGVPFQIFWSLRYRRPKSITVGIFNRLQAAYRAECERQMRKLQHEIEITKAKAGADCPAVREVEALVGEDS